MTQANALKTKVFAFAGIYVMRSERIYLLAVCHPIGVNGHGPHKHNDWLSFELCVDDQPVIIDPGTYCYTGNMKTRRLFRSTAYHNTVVVDGQEQIPIHDTMFGLNNPSGKVNVLCWESDEKHDFLEAEHTGYTRLESPVIHRRRFFLDKQNHLLEITDNFISYGGHMLEWQLHLEDELKCNRKGQNLKISKDGAHIMEISLSGWKMSPEIKKGWISKAYNQRKEVEVIYTMFQGEPSSSLSFVQQFIPSNILSVD